ncbi:MULTISPECIES: MerR family transcriptional regulator [Bacillus]|uniref:MerR family transcriptional regulator n=1 Tax=Bacillus TaxID=1386 RepID=UPI000853A386|nr:MULTISPECIES: MerR family transcriptional regulator [Bacillus]NLS40472.1 MerR family transcriptional regulator [Bacillus subtilis]MCM2583042.1 MerR family transcriptional regulator [Bacillus stercoris]MDZ5670468.1 MerR family transcriptional regulator [Bacillus stercoris]MEC2058547.1 MerR family transcriptional regulator [Bacillus stercoris]OIS67864.1 MerR family transcriptional regulator [Bacillus subtilis]
MFKIKEISEKTGITPHTLRFYEREGILPCVKRDSSGNRLYDEESMEWLNFILALRATGMPLAEIKKYVDLYREGENTLTMRKQMMLTHKEKVEKELSKTIKYLEQINYKLALYDMQEKELNKMLP